MKKTKSNDSIICIAGKNNVACGALSFLVSGNYTSKDNILVLANPERDVEWMGSLRKTACELNITVIETIEKLYKIKNLVFFSLEYSRIIRPDKFDSGELFNIHFSKLPAYKGMYTSAWPILNGEKTTGVTLHKIDHRIDGGDIIDQVEFPIELMDTCRDLYFKYNCYGIEMFKKNIGDILEQSYQAKPQPAYGSSYYSKKSINYKELVIDLNKTAFEVHNQIRAFTFPEYQLPEVHGYKVIKSEITDKVSTSEPGRIVEVEDTFIEIATIDYNVRLHKKNQGK